MVISLKALGFELWVCGTFPIFLTSYTNKKLEIATGYSWLGLRISINVFCFFLKRIEAEFL